MNATRRGRVTNVDATAQRALSVVAGGAGFAGSHLVDALLAAGDEVIIVDDLTDGYLSNVSDALDFGRATFVYLDPAAPVNHLSETLAGSTRGRQIDRVFLCVSSALGTDASIDGAAGEARSVMQAQQVIELAVRNDAPFVLVSELADWDDLETPHGFMPGIESTVARAIERRNVDGLIVRMLNLYGPRLRSGGNPLVRTLANAASMKSFFSFDGNADDRSTLLYVIDAITVMLEVIGSAARLPSQSPVITIAGTQEYSNAAIVERFAQIAGISCILMNSPGGVAGRTRRAPTRFTHAPAVATPLTEGLSSTIRWSRAHVGAFV